MIVTLLTDFGVRDYFVGAMKGVILSRDPRITIVDISHEVPRHDIEAAAFLLDACYRDFPGGTVHLVVVDPGVGSSRLALAARLGEHVFVAPNNGVLSLVLGGSPEAKLRRIDERYMRPAAGATFHGRDLFAPAAAELALGLPLEEIGPSIGTPVLIRSPSPARLPDGTLEGRILHIDHFGNCVTSFRAEHAPANGSWAFMAGEAILDRVVSHYAVGRPGVPLLIVGSTGYIEISINGESAAEALRLSRGDHVLLVPSVR